MRTWEELVRLSSQVFEFFFNLWREKNLGAQTFFKRPESPNPLSLDSQTLIFAGQILENDRTLASYGVPRVRLGEMREKERETRDAERPLDSLTRSWR